MFVAVFNSKLKKNIEMFGLNSISWCSFLSISFIFCLAVDLSLLGIHYLTQRKGKQQSIHQIRGKRFHKTSTVKDPDI